MREGEILLSQEQLKRYHLMGMVMEGKVTLVEAAQAMQVSYRHAKRIKERVAAQGAAGVVHGNRGRIPGNKLASQLRERVVCLSRERYAKCNDVHFTELLLQREGIKLSRETIRRLRRADGQRPKRRRRVSKRHYKRRERRPAEGVMMLWDGSPHRWFGREHGPCCLMAAIDDATGKVLALRFVPQETSAAYLQLLQQVVQGHGIPCSVYQDMHSALKRNDHHWSLQEQLEGRQELTQVGTALEALGITPIFALSAQAKGRVERLFGTLQDRLVALLSLQGVTDIAGANAYVDNGFCDAFNARFAQAPQESASAWRKVPLRVDLDRVCSFRYSATVGQDNTVRLGGHVLDIAPGPKGCGYAKQTVEVRQLLDGRWRIYLANQLLGEYPATPVVEPLRRRRRHPHAPGAHQAEWVYLASAPGEVKAASGKLRRTAGSGFRASRIA